MTKTKTRTNTKAKAKATTKEGKRLMKIREKCNDTVAQFAERMDVNMQTIYYWESGKSTPTGAHLALLNALEAGHISQAKQAGLEHVDTPEKVKQLTRRVMNEYGDDVGMFSRRIGVHRNNIERWLYDGNISRSGKYLLLLTAQRPELFNRNPQPVI